MLSAPPTNVIATVTIRHSRTQGGTTNLCSGNPASTRSHGDSSNQRHVRTLRPARPRSLLHCSTAVKTHACCYTKPPLQAHTYTHFQPHRIQMSAVVTHEHMDADTPTPTTCLGNSTQRRAHRACPHHQYTPSSTSSLLPDVLELSQQSHVITAVLPIRQVVLLLGRRAGRLIPRSTQHV